MSTLPSDFIHETDTSFGQQNYSTENGNTSLSTDIPKNESLLTKRKQKDDMDLDNSQDSKRVYTQPTSTPFARTRINQDKELWQVLNALKESSRTAGVIPRLEPHFTSLNRKGNTVAAYLCSSFTDHISTGLMDLGWGCGYRNAQMLMTFLQRKQQDGTSILQQVSDISGIQILLERAWDEGFDPQGAAQLHHQVYKTRKWIGTTEVYSILGYLGIRCTILDFHRPTGPNNTHEALMDWIQSYFESAIPKKKSTSDDQRRQQHQKKVVHVTNRPPLYLQHSGHSRTVIGIELLKDGKRNLIMFDPGRRMLRSYRNNKHDEQLQDPTIPEDDMEESPLSSVNGEDEEEYDNQQQHHDNDSYDDDSFDDDDDIDEVKTPNESSGNNISSPQRDTPPSTPSFTSRLLSGITQRTHLPANLLRPFRVDAKTIAKNRQYQILVLGDVIDERSQGGGLYWNESKGFLLDEVEREEKKNVTSIGMTF
ncbi:peptidase family C78-domain-containing protein [Halteromyces radiatus]|uniref:peptidase family C78-domain-containing protein n=1 Tax=Halteromyces radiatus TaxID=101107 RepID=UPI00221F4503|nr:peptidase family C78-domain-containing protein [Halteromyces radiatus]KAI8089829.1 peptidase family C78-domain-containing protein [Halteromyces radiatus]